MSAQRVFTWPIALRLGLRGKVVLATLAMVSIAGVLGAAWAERQVESYLVRLHETSLQHDADALLYLLDNGSTGDDAFADRAGKRLGVRVTLIDAHGQVMGDSEVAFDGLASLDNHLKRTEVSQALAEGTGSARRKSTVTDTEMLYVARRTTQGTGVAAVRVAQRISDVTEASTAVRVFFVAGGAISLVVATLMSAVAAHLVTRRLRRALLRTQQHASKSREADTMQDELAEIVERVSLLDDELQRHERDRIGEHDRYEAALATMTEGVFAIDAHGEILLLNPPAMTFLAALGVSNAAAGVRLHKPSLNPDVAEALLGPTARDASAELPTSDGRVLWIRSTESRTFAGTVVVIHDVTDIRKLERMRRDFVANVSHELRTPLSIIHANAETLLGGALDDAGQAQRFVEAIQRNTARLSRLVADLLDISRMESGQHRLERTPVSLGNVAEHLRQNLAAHAESKQHRIDVDIAGDAVVVGDSAAIEQVLLNLVDNAIKYSPAGSCVRIIAVSDSAQMVRLRVEDNGPGIDVKHHARLFERFYRVDKGRARDAGGTGLGLAIVKHLVEGMGGRVGVETLSPSGTCFWFTLPRA